MINSRSFILPAAILMISLGGCSCGRTDEPGKNQSKPEAQGGNIHSLVSAPAKTSRPAGDTIEPARLGTYMAGGRGLYGSLDVWKQDFQRSRKLKIGVVRFNSDVWTMLEPRRGEYQWEPLDKLVALLQEEDVEILFTIPISNKWNTPEQNASVYGHPVGPSHFPTPDLKGFEDFCRALCSRYKGKINHYEVWNEPDFPMFWKGDMEPDPAEYLPFLKTAYAVIKKIDPDATVMNGGIAMAGNTRWLDKFLELGGAPYTDALNIHIYPAFGQYPDSLDLNQQVLARHGVRKKIWITETSTTGAFFETQDRRQEELDKAVYLVKNYTRVFARPDVERVFWHTLTNPGKDVRLPKDYDFGLVASDGSTLPAYMAHEIWSRILMGSQPLHRGRSEDGAQIYEFERKGDRIVVAWTDASESDYSIPSEWSKVRITTIDGKTQDVDGQSPILIRLTKTPVFVELSRS